MPVSKRAGADAAQLAPVVTPGGGFRLPDAPGSTSRMTDGAAESGPLGDRAASGVLWSVAQKWTMRIGGLVTVAILARLLTPGEFGLVAAATAFVPVLYLVADLGFSTYLVQADDVSDRTVSTAFWYTVTAGSGFAVVLLAVGPFIARSLGQPDVAPVLAALSPTVLLVALSSVPIALLRRRFAFRALAIQSCVAGILGQVVAVGTALAGAGVWALVAQLVVHQLAVGVLAWGFCRFRPRRVFSWRSFAVMGRFGAKVIAVEFVALTRFWAEAAVVTAALGVTGLGYLAIAQRLIQAAQDLSAAAVVPVSTVVFARVRSAADQLVGVYLRASETICVLVMPVMAGISVAAPLLVPLAFGDQWHTSIAPAQALAVAGVLTLGATLDHGLLYGTGRPGRWLLYALAIDLLTVGTTMFGVRLVLLGVSLGFVGVAVVATVARWVMVARLTGASVRTVARPFVAAGTTTLVGAAAGVGARLATQSVPDLAALVVIGVVILVVHAAAVRVLLPAQYVRMVRLVGTRLPARRPQPFDAHHPSRAAAGPEVPGPVTPTSSRRSPGGVRK